MPSLASTSTYLDNLYQEKFGRKPDAAGKAYWQGQLESGAATAESVAAAFDASQEAKDREDKGVEVGVADEQSFQDALTAASAPAPSPAPAPYNAEEEYNNTVNSTVAAFNAPAPAPSPAPAPAPAADDDDGPIYTLPYIDPDSEEGKRQAINDIYRDVLERNTDEGGEDYWYKELESGNQTLADIRSNIEGSKEAADLESNKAFIESQYQEGLDRGTLDNIDDAADPYGGGIGYWLKDLATGQSRDDVAANIRRSEEFSTQASDYLEGLYENILDRDPDAEGMDYWKKSLIDGTQTRDDVKNNFNISDEKWLGDVYKNELGRNLRDEGRKYWLDDINNKGQSRDDVLANIRRSEEYACAQSGGNWDGSECKQALAPCPEGQLRPPGGTSCAPVPTNCPEGTAWDGTSCRPTGSIDEHVCPDGSIVSDASQCPTTPTPEAPCPAGMSRGDDGNCKPDATIPNYHTCPDGSKVINPADCGSGGGEEPPSTAPCPNGQTRNPDGTCPTSGTYMGPDPNEKPEGDGKLPGEWMGDQNSDDEYERLYNDKAKEMVRLYGGDEGGTAASDRIDQLQSDYDDARREADSYINANRDEELSKLRRGITVGGFPGSRRNDLRSGGTAYSDRSRKRSRITAGPRIKEDRPYAARGIRGGYSSGSTYFDSGSSF